MKISFKRNGERVSFTAHPKKGKLPARLKKYQFKAGSKKQESCHKKAMAALRKLGWKV